jgi:plasmid stabilization system protein ParE
MISYTLLVTRKADKDEQLIYEYIAKAFGEVYALKFRQKLIGLFTTLIKYPFLGRVAKNDNSLRVVLFSKQNKIVYKVTEKEIVIIRILNTRTHTASNY